MAKSIGEEGINSIREMDKGVRMIIMKYKISSLMKAINAIINITGRILRIYISLEVNIILTTT